MRRPGDFSAGGLCDMFAPRLEVEGVGPVALPLLPAQAEELIAVSRRAPFGRGRQTLVDIDVRRTWQIAPDQVRIDGQGWARTLAEIVRRAADGLGVTDPVTAEFYKLLVYDEGSFFVGHRDSEKAPGMFGTLVIVLPSTSAGGELVVRHEGQESRYDLRCPEPSQAAFAAFYADCLHEVLPVTSGCRLTLVYNLLRGPVGTTPKPPDYGVERTALTALLREWTGDGEVPAKLVYPLEHAYTPAGLSFAALKGADAAKAATILGAVQDADCELHLALLSIAESGSAEHTGGYRSWRGRGDEDEDEFEVIEVHDRSETLSDWCRPDGGPAGLGPLPLDVGEVVPPHALDDMAPDDESFQEATGNEGASFERTYRRAALVLWPRLRRIEVINQGGLPATLPCLADLAERWAAGGGSRASDLWAEAHDLSGHMIATWPRERGWRARPSPQAGSLLATLCRLGDHERIDAFLAEVAAAGLYAKGQADDIVPALRLLTGARAAALCEAIVAGNAPVAFADAAEFLAVAVATLLLPDPGALRPAAHALLAAMPGDPTRRSEELSWFRPGGVEPDTVIDVLNGLGRIDPESAETMAIVMLARPTTYGFDTVLIPALLKLGAVGGAAPDRLRRACLEHLDARIALPLAPPGDWSRDGTLNCACRHCADLGRFLVDPARSSWSLKAVQGERSHVENTILNSGSDLDRATQRKGSPHTLVCTKNQASYERRANQRARDLADHARISQAT